MLDLVKDAKAPVFLILNKIDLIKKSKLLPIIERLPASWAASPRSSRCRRRPATTSIGSSGRSSIGCRKGEPLYPDDYLTDQPERFFAAEIVREKLLQFTHAEIPFSSAVVVDRFEEPDGRSGLLRLYCTIVVDRESQKPIVVGKGGDMIKRIGTAAREELERFFDDAGVSRSARAGEGRVARGRARAARTSALGDAPRRDGRASRRQLAVVQLVPASGCRSTPPTR